MDQTELIQEFHLYQAQRRNPEVWNDEDSKGPITQPAEPYQIGPW